MTLLLLTPAIGALLGFVAGSFTAALAHRGPPRWGLVERDAPDGLGGRSRCVHCGAALGARNLVPLASFALNRGRARCCGAAIPARYPVIEALGAVVGALAAWRFGLTVDALAAALIGWTALGLGAIDARDGVLPDAMTGPLLWLGLLANVGDRFARLDEAVMAAAAGYLGFRAIEEGYRLFRGRDGLGRGDAKFLAGWGAVLGWRLLPSVVLAAAALALASVLIARVVRKKTIAADTSIAFGPPLAAAGFVVLIAFGGR
ncbi:MAG: A24 family peptidase [Pseudomonadota bacterium]